jgi:hypothetical protein
MDQLLNGIKGTDYDAFLLIKDRIAKDHLPQLDESESQGGTVRHKLLQELNQYRTPRRSGSNSNNSSAQSTPSTSAYASASASSTPATQYRRAGDNSGEGIFLVPPPSSLYSSSSSGASASIFQPKIPFEVPAPRNRAPKSPIGSPSWRVVSEQQQHSHLPQIYSQKRIHPEQDDDEDESGDDDEEDDDFESDGSEGVVSHRKKPPVSPLPAPKSTHLSSRMLDSRSLRCRRICDAFAPEIGSSLEATCRNR